MNTYEEKEEANNLHLYCRLFMLWGPWFALDDLYSRYYAVARERVGCGRLDADADADAD